MKAPILQKGFHSVLVVEYKTGIVLNREFKRSIDSENVFWEFKNHEESIKFINSKLVADSNLEFTLYDSSGNYLETKTSIKY